MAQQGEQGRWNPMGQVGTLSSCGTSGDTVVLQDERGWCGHQGSRKARVAERWGVLCHRTYSSFKKQSSESAASMRWYTTMEKWNLILLDPK